MYNVSENESLNLAMQVICIFLHVALYPFHPVDTEHTLTNTNFLSFLGFLIKIKYNEAIVKSRGLIN